MATLRFSRVSRARYTSPMPAASAGGTISYGPSFVPEARVIGARNYSPVRRAAVDATTLATKLLWLIPRDGPDPLFLQVDSLSFHVVQIFAGQVTVRAGETMLPFFWNSSVRKAER
jgi:hypothetical protein